LGEGGGVKNKPFHFRPDLQPVSRFGEVELREHWESLAKFVINEAEGRGEPVVEGESDLGRRLKLLGLKEPDEALLAVLEEWSKAKSNTPPRSKPTESTLNDGLASALPPGPANGLSDDDLKAFYTKVTNRNPGVVPIPDPAKLEAHSRPFIFIHQDDLDDRLFDQLWARGEPMVVDGVSERFKLGWTPRDFIDRFGNEQCGE
jgi:lysine-specific demethylase 3